TAVLTVTDDGPGIPVADRERVFERFVRLDPARPRLHAARDDSRTLDSGGAGLGLAIVRELVRRHGGSVTVADAALAAEPLADGPGSGPGLRVTVRLPAADDA